MTTYLEVPFRAKDEVKALGARWDAVARKWFVPGGRDLAPFRAWLPEAVAEPEDAQAVSDQSSQGVTLSVLLAGVARAVADAFAEGVWTRVEVVETRMRQGHVYLEVSERGADGSVLARANAMIWAAAASRILPAFEQATGAVLAPGIKLRVRARPVFKPQYGFSLEIDAIDPEYTLGDLEARKREIRLRLQQEGLFERNRHLPPPWDFNGVLVIAPEGAAGLGDFQAEAQRLMAHGVCDFRYATSRFQGEGAAAEIVQTLSRALTSWREAGDALPDAVVIIRGGGAVNDLAWLNDYPLAKRVCELEIPVLTGIGHERDSCILDEVAHIAFDTPSKVILGIEQRIRQRVDEVKAGFLRVSQTATRILQNLRTDMTVCRDLVLQRADQVLVHARERTDERIGQVRDRAWQQVNQARSSSTALFREIIGQGPEKTLRRGFSLVRDEAGHVVTRAESVVAETPLWVEFLDATLVVNVKDKVKQ